MGKISDNGGAYMSMITIRMIISKKTSQVLLTKSIDRSVVLMFLLSFMLPLCIYCLPNIET